MMLLFTAPCADFQCTVLEAALAIAAGKQKGPERLQTTEHHLSAKRASSACLCTIVLALHVLTLRNSSQVCSLAGRERPLADRLLLTSAGGLASSSCKRSTG